MSLVAGAGKVSSVDGGGRRRDIQGLRALAVIMVVAFHAGLPVPGGFVGVDVFFVISGFVITSMLMRERKATGRVRLGRFYLRRFKRLTPALALMVCLVSLSSALLLSPLGDQQAVAATAVGAMLLIANVVIARTTGSYFGTPAESNPLLHTWSLSVEEQFYLVFPALLLVVLARAMRSRRYALVSCVIVGFVGVGSFLLAYAGSIGLDLPFLPDSLLGFYSAATRAWEFTAGAALALVGASSKVASSRYAVLLMWLGFGMLLSSLWLITEKTPFPGLWTLLPVSASLILLAAGLRDGVVSGVLASRLFVAIGDRSYSIYLWHWPFIVFAQLMRPNSTGVLLLAALLSLVPAFASFRWIEVPIRNSPLNGGGRLVRLVAATLVVPLTLASALGFAAHNGYWDSSVRSYQVAIQPFHSGAAAGCTEGAWRKPVACTWNLRGAGQPIYLVGDSNADHFSEAIIGAAKSSSRPLVSLTENGCEYVPVSLALTDVFAERRCRTYFEGTQRYLLAAPPGLVVVANSYSWFTHPDSEVAVGRVGSPPSRDPKVKLEALGSGLSAAVRSLDSRGHSVLLVQAVPHWKGEDAFTWATCPMLELLSRGCSHSMRLSDVFTRQGAAAEVVSSVAESSGMVALDLTSELCAGGVCSSVGNSGIIRYRDALHITVEQSQALSAVFEKAIEEVGPS